MQSNGFLGANAAEKGGKPLQKTVAKVLGHRVTAVKFEDVLLSAQSSSEHKGESRAMPSHMVPCCFSLPLRHTSVDRLETVGVPISARASMK